MADPNTLRILEFDGGGERGYFSLTWFNKFIQQWGIDPTTIPEQFDVICGTSVGGIMALSLAYGMTPDEMFPFFTEQGPYIFSLSSLFPSWRPNSITKAGLILAGIPFYQSSGPTADFYGSGLLAKTLQNNFGTTTLQDLSRTNVLIPSFQQDTNRYVLFSNRNINGLIGQDSLISDIALATGSAPVYLPPWSFGGHSYIDGGIYQNNPASLGISAGKIIKPNATRICVLSIGTGLGELGFDPSGSNGIPLENNPLSTNNLSPVVIVTIPDTSVLKNGQNVTISGATDTGGITSNQLNITAVISIINSTTFYYVANGIATSSAQGGGNSVVVDYIEEDTFLKSSKFKSLKKSNFHKSGVNHEQFKKTPVYEKLIRIRPDIAKQIELLSLSKSPLNASPFDTIELIFNLFSIASVGGQESVAQAILLESSYTLDSTFYHRFNTRLDSSINSELDSTDSTTLNYYHTQAINLFNQDITKISNFIGHLTA